MLGSGDIEMGNDGPGKYATQNITNSSRQSSS